MENCFRGREILWYAEVREFLMKVSYSDQIIPDVWECVSCIIDCQNMVQEWKCMRRILSAWEKTPRKQNKRLGIPASWKHGIVLEMCFCTLPRCNGQQWIYLRLSLTTGYCYLFTFLFGKHFCYVQFVCQHVVCPGGCALYSCVLNPQNTNCSMLQVKLAVAWDFSSPYLSASFYQVPLLLE